ncbi:MAG: nucleotide exchange factor GrpE [Methylovirgula sp.]
MPDAKLNENAEPVAAPEPQADSDPRNAAQNPERDNAELRDKLLRALAELENLRRRTEKEVADAKLYGTSSLARDMLGFADNLHRAIDNVPRELRESSEAVRTLLEGLELTERDFLTRLARHRIKKMEALGTKFDPNLHEALYEVPDDSVPNGRVVKVAEDGYMIGGRMLRPAKVGVSRGAAKSEA